MGAAGHGPGDPDDDGACRNIGPVREGGGGGVFFDFEGDGGVEADCLVEDGHCVWEGG